MRISLTSLDNCFFEIYVAARLWSTHKSTAYLYPIRTQRHCSKHSSTRGDTTGGHKPYGVNVPLLYSDLDEILDIIIEEKVPIVFTSAGNPKSYTPQLKEAGITVVHVVSSVKFALKSQEAGVDAVVAEGFEAGGHNGREESTTLTLIPQVAQIFFGWRLLVQLLYLIPEFVAH